MPLVDRDQNRLSGNRKIADSHSAPISLPVADDCGYGRDDRAAGSGINKTELAQLLDQLESCGEAGAALLVQSILYQAKNEGSAAPEHAISDRLVGCVPHRSNRIVQAIQRWPAFCSARRMNS
jgi:hypothetical protein